MHNNTGIVVTPSMISQTCHKVKLIADKNKQQYGSKKTTRKLKKEKSIVYHSTKLAIPDRPASLSLFLHVPLTPRIRAER